MNNLIDNEWFGKENIFNTEIEHNWIVNNEKIQFDNSKSWQEYVNSNRLEITCGEAPFIVSRYDTTTGEIIPIKKRIGILDRKIRVINENVDNETEWLKWVLRAFQSVYGYEFQGDNLLIARINLLNTYVDYMQDRWKHVPTNKELKEITNIIVWNFWQMDGLRGTIPFDKNNTECMIYDWENDKSITFNSLKEDR